MHLKLASAVRPAGRQQLQPGKLMNELPPQTERLLAQRVVRADLHLSSSAAARLAANPKPRDLSKPTWFWEGPSAKQRAPTLHEGIQIPEEEAVAPIGTNLRQSDLCKTARLQGDPNAEQIAPTAFKLTSWDATLFKAQANFMAVNMAKAPSPCNRRYSFNFKLSSWQAPLSKAQVYFMPMVFVKAPPPCSRKFTT